MSNNGRLAPKTSLNSHLNPYDLNEVVAVMTSGRTGSGLILSILDNHPRVLSFPDSTLMNFSDFWQTFGTLNLDTLVEEFITAYAFAFDGEAEGTLERMKGNVGFIMGFQSMGENADEVLSADVHVFRSSMHKILGGAGYVPRGIFFRAAHIAYANACGRQVEQRPIIVFSLHIANSSSVRSFLDDFERPKFLHMVREPVQTSGSHFKMLNMENTLSPGSARYCISVRFSSGEAVSPEAWSDSRAVQLESLHTEPESTLLATCGWLGLEWNNSLLESTFNGLRFWNEPKSIRSSGFNPEIIRQAYAQYISNFDRYRLRMLFCRRFRAFGYYTEMNVARRQIVQILCFPSFFLPFRMEILSWRWNTLRQNFSEYLYLRRAILNFILFPPRTVPNIF